MIYYYPKRIMVPHSEDSTITDALTTFRQLVETRDYDRAHAHWAKLQGQVDGFTYWYNLGSLEALRKNYPEARFALETARHYAVYSQPLEQQLTEVTSVLDVDANAASAFPHNVLTLGLDLGIGKLWFLAVLVLVAAAITAVKASTRMQKALGLALGSLPALAVLWLQLSSVLFVTLKPLPLFEGPTTALPLGKELVPGSRLIGWRYDDWVKVYESSGAFVWLPVTDLRQSAGLLWGNLE